LELLDGNDRWVIYRSKIAAISVISSIPENVRIEKGTGYLIHKTSSRTFGICTLDKVCGLSPLSRTTLYPTELIIDDICPLPALLGADYLDFIQVSNPVVPPG
jgi:hypothetical protein